MVYLCTVCVCACFSMYVCVKMLLYYSLIILQHVVLICAPCILGLLSTVVAKIYAAFSHVTTSRYLAR